jgi:DNA-binding CsgD family transcriptional regulator
MLHANDVRAMLRLLGEVRELGANSTAWRAHLAASLQRLCGCRATLALEITFPVAHPITEPWSACRSTARLVDAAESGIAAADRQHFYDDMLWHRHGTDDTLNSLVPLYGTQFTRSRQELVGDERWYRSPLANEIFRAHDCDAFIISTVPVMPHTYASLGLVRAWGDRPFGAREKVLVELIHEELSRDWLYQREPRLSPRQREVLELLRAGASEKEVAAALEVSTHTVHDHVKALHRAYRVRSRGELMARAMGSRPRVCIASVAYGSAGAHPRSDG